MKEAKTENGKDLFAAMERVASRDDFLCQKTAEVMGDYVRAQCFISNSIYVCHQDPETRLQPRRRANIIVPPLKDVPPRPIYPTPSSLQGMTINVPDSPKTKVSGSTRLNCRPTPSPVMVKFPPNGIFPVSEIKCVQKNTSLESVESIKSKPREDLSLLLHNQFDGKQKIDTDIMIKEMTLPRLISPINSPENRMSVEMVLKEMVTNISPLSPISNPKRETEEESADKSENPSISSYKHSPSVIPKIERFSPKIKGKRLEVKIDINLFSESFRNHCYPQIVKQNISPSSKPAFSSSSVFSNSSGNQRKKTRSEEQLIKQDTKHVPKENAFRHSFVEEGDSESLFDKQCILLLLRMHQDNPQEIKKIVNDVRKLLQENSESCYSRAKNFKQQAKNMTRENKMFLHLLAGNWFVLCGYHMEKEGRSQNSLRKYWQEMASFLNNIGCFEDVCLKSIYYLLRAVICQRLYELYRERRQQLQTELNTEYKSKMGIPFCMSESVFQKKLDDCKQKHGNDNLDKSISVSYRFLQLKKEYQSLIELLIKGQEFLSKAQKLMQEKSEFFNFIQCRLRNLNIYSIEIPLIVDFVKTCTELLRPKDLGFVNY